MFYTSDDYLYHKKCFTKLKDKSPITGQDFSYYQPVNKLVNDKVYFEKNMNNTFRIIYNLDGFDGVGFNKEGFDGNGFNRKGVDEYGYNSKKELACKWKLKQAKTDNPNNYQYATLRLKHNVDLAIFFLEQSG